MPAVFSIDLITGFLGFLFTILILSYVIGDNPGFRLAIHAFVGISAGYVFIVILRQVIGNRILLPLFTGSILERLLATIPLILGLLLMSKTSSRFEWLGRPVVALLVGVGTAVAVTGAVLGTIFPQVLAAAQLFDLRASTDLGSVAGNLVTGGFALVGTIVTLVYFQFSISKKQTGGNRGRLLGFIATLGQVFIAITLGAIFAGVLAAALSALADRMQSLVLFIEPLVFMFIK